MIAFCQKAANSWQFYGRLSILEAINSAITWSFSHSESRRKYTEADSAIQCAHQHKRWRYTNGCWCRFVPEYLIKDFQTICCMLKHSHDIFTCDWIVDFELSSAGLVSNFRASTASSWLHNRIIRPFLSTKPPSMPPSVHSPSMQPSRWVSQWPKWI